MWKTELIPCPVCGQGHQADYLRRICGLSREMQGWTLDAFATPTPSHKEALRAARTVVQEPRFWLIFWGLYGVGKTHLLAAIVNGVRARGLTAVYTTMADLLDHFRRAYNPSGKEPDFDGLWQKVTTATCLAIDELDRFNMTPWAREKLFQLAEERYRNAGHSLTVFATNCKVEQGVRILEEDAGYLESRLLDGRNRVIHITGGDVRPALERQKTEPERERSWKER